MIRLVKEQDYDELYKLSKELLRNHENQGENTWITLENFRGLVEEKFVQFYILTTKVHEENFKSTDSGYEFEQGPSKRQRNEGVEEVAGYVAFLDDYDLHFGGLGILVDQFFVSKECRGRGHGKHLLNEVYKQALTRGAKYVKLFFQQREDRNAIYKRLGYKNRSDTPPFLRFYEIYGPNNIKKHLGLDIFDAFRMVQKESKHPRIHILQYKEDGFDYIIKNLKLISDMDYKENYPFPNPDLVIVAKYPTEMHSHSEQSLGNYFKRYFGPKWVDINEDPRVIWTGISEISGEHDLTVQLCGFVERPSICCWLGHKLDFSNFVGDLSLITKDLIVRRIHYWSSEWGPILGVDFEITGDENEEPTAENNALIRTLNSLGVNNDDSWKCAILEEKQIRANFEKEA